MYSSLKRNQFSFINTQLIALINLPYWNRESLSRLKLTTPHKVHYTCFTLILSVIVYQNEKINSAKPNVILTGKNDFVACCYKDQAS